MTWDHLHDEDILFEFRGDDPDDLVPGRFYRGTVDGFAEFGVFVTLGDSITGLLHHSKLDRRLESLDWEVGDEVIVQVEGVRENGNIDLAWSIRQSSDEFRGHDVDPPDTKESVEESVRTPDLGRDIRSDETSEVKEPTSPPEEERAAPTKSIARRTTTAVEDAIGERVRLEGRITDVRQTSGPTIFSLTDEDGTIECAAFEEAGVRAYPTIEQEDIVRIVGLVERHRGDLQIESESIETLADPERTSVLERIREATRERARPEDSGLLLVDPVVADLTDDIIATATRLRRAVFSGRRILIRHPATADGVIAGAALEHALVRLAEREGTSVDGSRRIERRPVDEPWYELGDAMYDRGGASEDESILMAFVGVGSSVADAAAIRFLDLYDIPAVVVDAYADGSIDEELVDAAAISQAATTVTVLAAHVGGMVDETVRSELAPLPAISYRDNPPDRYAGLASDHGLNADTVRERHEAIALTAYYQRYDDKRELIRDLLFETDAAALAAHVSAQYRERVDRAIETAGHHCERITVDGHTITVLDADAHSHRFDFPSRQVLTAELLRTERETGDGDLVLVLGADECYLDGPIDTGLPAIATDLTARIPQSTVEVQRDRLSFLAGERDEIRDALVQILADELT